MSRRLLTRIKIKNENIGQKGFTLVELLIYMGLLAILLVILTEILVSILNVKLESEATSSVEQDGRYILSRLAYDINRADSITTPVNPGDTGDTLEIIIDGVSNSYSESGNDLQLTNGSGTNNLNSSETSISDLILQRLGNAGGKNSIKLQFTVISVAVKSGGAEQKIYSTTIGLRN